jgi:predicted secreted Zn-dependent protease
MHHKGGRSVGVAWCGWQIGWDPEYVQTPHGYIIKNSNTKIVVTYRYPRWIDRDNASGDLRKEWDALVQNAMVHEKGHGAIAKEGAYAVEKALMAVPSHKDIRIFSGRVNAAGSKVIRDYKIKEQQYDKRTNYGRRQEAADQPDRPVSKTRNSRTQSKDR